MTQRVLVGGGRDRAGAARDTGGGAVVGTGRHDVADPDPTTRAQHASDLGGGRLLVGGQHDDAVGDHDVDRRVLQRHLLDRAVEELHVGRPGVGRVATGQLQHLAGRVETVREPARTDPPRRQQHVDPASRAEVQHDLAGTQVGDGHRVATTEAPAHGRVGHAGEVVVVAGAERRAARLARLAGRGTAGRIGVAGARIGHRRHQQVPLAQTSPLSSHGATSGRRPMISSAADGKQARQRSLIRHRLCVPTRSTCTKHVSPRICR